MNNKTLTAIRRALEKDLDVSDSERRAILGLLRAPDNDASNSRIITRREAARMLHRSPRTVDRLGKSNVLTRRILPGRKRAVGYSHEEVESFVRGGVVCSKSNYIK